LWRLKLATSSIYGRPSLPQGRWGFYFHAMETVVFIDFENLKGEGVFQTILLLELGLPPGCEFVTEKM
jgi:hypothetical protein